jgi:hypothetical protein
VAVSTSIRQLGHAATSHSWQRAVRPGCSKITPHSHVVDIAIPLPRSRCVLRSVTSTVRAPAAQINIVIVFISEINYFYQ